MHVLEPTILSIEVPFDASEVTGNAGASAFIRMSAINTNKDTSTIRTLQNKDISLLPRDGPNVRLWHSAEAEGLGRLTERMPNVRPNVVCYDETTSFTGERTERPENVVSKHVNTHASSEMANYVEKLQRIVYEQK